MDESANTSVPTGENEQEEDVFKAKIADLERESYMLKQQLDESQEKCEEFTKENASLKASIQSLEKANLEKGELNMQLDKERESLLAERVTHQKEITELKGNKDSVESQIERLTNEKKQLTEDLGALVEEVKRFKEKGDQLQAQINDFQSEKTALDIERQAWAREMELTAKNREWYTKEISDRETTISSLRLEVLNFERQLAADRKGSEEQIHKFEKEIETLGAAVAIHEEENDKLRLQVNELVKNRDESLKSIKEELNLKEVIISTFQEKIDNLESEIKILKSDDEELRKALKTKDEALLQVQTEAKKLAEESSNQLAERDLKIIHLQDELDKANELLRYGGSQLGASTGDLPAVSPAAASVAELVSSGASLTAIYAKHCKVIGELTEERKARKQLEEYVENLVEEFRQKAPNILLLKKEYEVILEENDEFKRRINEMFEENEDLRTKKNNAERELGFTKGDLTASQRENDELKKQVRKFIYHLEHQNDPLGQEESGDDASSFLTIAELHDKYMNSLTQIEELKASHEEIVKRARLEEIDTMQQEVDRCRQQIEVYQDIEDKLRTTVADLEKERNYLKVELERITSEGRAILEAEITTEWKNKYDSLEAKLEYVLKDKKLNEGSLNGRIEHLNNLISELKSTNAHLESNFEMQKKNQELAIKKVVEFEKEIKKKTEEAIKYKLATDSLETRIQDLNFQIKEKIDETCRLRGSLHQANEDLSRAESNVNQLRAEVDVLKEKSIDVQRFNSALASVEGFLKSPEVSQFDQLKTRLKEAELTRDDLNKNISELKSANEHLSSEVQKLEAIARAKEQISMELSNQRQQYSALQAKLQQISNERDELQNKLGAVGSADSSNDALKKDLQQHMNKNIYLEKQVTEQAMELDRLRNALESKEKEKEEFQSFSGNLESTMSKKVVELEKELEALRNEHTDTKKKLVSVRELARRYRDGPNEKLVALTTENTKLKEELDKAKAELQQMFSPLVGGPDDNSRLVGLRKNLSTKITENTNLKKEKEELVKQNQSITQEKTNLETKLAELEAKVDELAQKETESTFRNKSLDTHLRKVLDNQNELRQQLSTVESERDSLKSEVGKLKQQVSAASSQSAEESRKRVVAPTMEQENRSIPKRRRIVYNEPSGDERPREIEPEPEPEADLIEPQEQMGLEEEEEAIEREESAAMNEQPSYGALDKVPSVERDEQEDNNDDDNVMENPVDAEMEEIPPDDNIGAPSDGENDDQQMYVEGGQEEGDSYSEPPQFVNFDGEEESYEQQDQQQFAEGGLPNPYYNEGGDDEDDYEDNEDDNVEDDDDEELDVHSGEQSEGDDFGGDQKHDEDDDEDIVVLN
ncbi:hypothetical protein FO519_003215 [Halicephalobus sp. NKZ332]|nr:hypothetical protein FO519_003215 [Halicephalobus sp. NKZ332]